MHRTRPLVLVLLVLPMLGADSAPDTYPRRTGIDVENYRFELTLSDDTDDIVGRATVSLRFRANGVVAVPLDLTSVDGSGVGMRVSSVTASGVALDYTHEGDLLTIRLAEPGRAGHRIDLTVEYSGAPAAGLRIGPNKYGDRTFFSDNWPNRARNWLPTIDHVYEKAMNEFVVTAPSHYQVVSNGVLVEETDLGNGARLTHWKQSVPISPWLYVLGVARFAVQNVGDFEGKPIQTWVYAQDRDAGFYDFAVPTKQVLEFYDEHVGPFAYEKLANVTSPATGGGMEAASAVMYSENSVTGDRSVRWRNVVIHEIAHQWFGNAVTERDWDHVWLSEGFATYFTLLFREHAYGRDDFVDGLKGASESVFTQYDQDPDYRIVHDNLDDMSRVTSGATYQKGAWVLHMLRKRTGDEAFWAGIQAYYGTHMNGSATTDDFRRAMEQASGENLEAFFRQWLYQGGNPHLEGWWRYDPTAQAVSIEINQTQTNVGLFDLPLEVGVYMGDSERPTAIHTVQVTSGFHRFVIPVDGEPEDVRLDPDTWALFRGELEHR
jgi:aminopeptidase N